MVSMKLSNGTSLKIIFQLQMISEQLVFLNDRENILSIARACIGALR